ncbi:DUF6624 domain-containing protein [Costertonia aggregata]|uniref:Uncharacterized protein n=1 Tax=Costertonia aggregata TaxID=343403 RepID=A0A7H9AR56_9FLAO|nr:DUF6624 domain-containing protein [Costertonia aggregata]QLG45896.1 hypothetical protein HYG79_11235 [Costertonia aggregata]
MKQTILITIVLSINFSVSGQSQKELDSLKVKLETIFMKDQTFRRIYTEAENKLGKDSDAYEYFWQVVEAQDKVLEKEVIKIIDKFGWLGISEVGRLANTTLWSVLQHGSIASKKKYAPLLKASVLKKESQPSHYARLVDRMLINSDKPQIYGTQIDYSSSEAPTFFPIEKPEYINQRRKEIGLDGIENSVGKNGIEWNIAQKEK